MFPALNTLDGGWMTLCSSAYLRRTVVNLFGLRGQGSSDG